MSGDGEPAGFGPGPGLVLIQARQRLIRAVLTIQLQEAGSSSLPITFAGSEGTSGAYAEMSAAARLLVLAQNAWDDYLEARRAEKAWFAPVSRAGQTGQEGRDGS